jgi:hypothetical protein
MKIFFCLTIAFAAATFVQAHQWTKILNMAEKRQKTRYCYTRHFILSATFVVASTLLGLIPTAIKSDLLAYAFAGAIGFAPWATSVSPLRIWNYDSCEWTGRRGRQTSPQANPKEYGQRRDSCGATVIASGPRWCAFRRRFGAAWAHRSTAT